MLIKFIILPFYLRDVNGVDVMNLYGGYMVRWARPPPLNPPLDLLTCYAFFLFVFLTSFNNNYHLQ